MYFHKSLHYLIVLACFQFLLPSFVTAQLTVDGEFRPRTEYRNGYRILRTVDTDPAFFTSQRTRLNLMYKSDDYRIKISGQDVRVWGEVAQLQDNANVNIHEAWAELYISDYLNLKLGRQELIYDDHRLLGSVNWTQQARSHDALILKYYNSDTGFNLNIGGAYNQDSEQLLNNNYTLNNYKVLSYLWLNKSFKPFEISVIGVTDGFQNGTESVNFRYTYGTHLVYAKNDLKWTGTVYLQNGDDATRSGISGVLAASQATYSLGDLTVSAGYDYLSGGDSGDAFHTLYATNHKFYGNMDYFLNIPADTQNGGLQDLFIKTSFSLGINSNISATYHNFALSERFAAQVGSGETLDKFLGSELDLNFTHSFYQEISVKVGYSILYASETLEQIQQREANNWQHWGWVMLSLTPNFFN